VEVCDEDSLSDGDRVLKMYVQQIYEVHDQ